MGQPDPAEGDPGDRRPLGWISTRKRGACERGSEGSLRLLTFSLAALAGRCAMGNSGAGPPSTGSLTVKGAPLRSACLRHGLRPPLTASLSPGADGDPSGRPKRACRRARASPYASRGRPPRVLVRGKSLQRKGLGLVRVHGSPASRRETGPHHAGSPGEPLTGKSLALQRFLGNVGGCQGTTPPPAVAEPVRVATWRGVACSAAARIGRGRAGTGPGDKRAEPLCLAGTRPQSPQRGTLSR